MNIYVLIDWTYVTDKQELVLPLLKRRLLERRGNFVNVAIHSKKTGAELAEFKSSGFKNNLDYVCKIIDLYNESN